MRRGIERRLLVVIAFRGSDSRIEETGLALPILVRLLGEKKRPEFLGRMGACQCVGSIVGFVLAGTFTSAPRFRPHTGAAGGLNTRYARSRTHAQQVTVIYSAVRLATMVLTARLGRLVVSRIPVDTDHFCRPLILKCRLQLNSPP
jgi:hypothetical protein